MKFACLDELNVWKESVLLARDIYKTINDNAKIKNDFGLKEQMQRSAISIPSNIAEGFERETGSEFIRSLYIAKGSCAELKTQLLIAKEVGYVDEASYKQLVDSGNHISVMIFKLIEYLKSIKKRKK